MDCCGSYPDYRHSTGGGVLPPYHHPYNQQSAMRYPQAASIFDNVSVRPPNHYDGYDRFGYQTPPYNSNYNGNIFGYNQSNTRDNSFYGHHRPYDTFRMAPAYPYHHHREHYNSDIMYGGPRNGYVIRDTSLPSPYPYSTARNVGDNPYHHHSGGAPREFYSSHHNLPNSIDSTLTNHAAESYGEYPVNQFTGSNGFTSNSNATVCGPPAVPLNAKVKTVSGDLGINQASYECDSGYELFGPSTTKCDPKNGWEKDFPFCGTNVAYRKPVNQSSGTRLGPASFANDGKLGNQNPDGQECSETQKEPAPWWRVDLLHPQTIRVVRITTRGCCGHQPIQDLEIRVGNSSTDLQRNPLCAWFPGTMDEGVTRTFACARPLIGQYVAIQLVGVEGSLSLCEVEVFSNDEFSPERCAAPDLNADTVLATFSRTCYEFHVTRGENFDKARQICQSHGNVVLKPAWGKDQPNNYNGEQNCVVLDGGRNWLWNDVGCNLDYLHFVCQHEPLSCGSPDSLQNTTVIGRNFTVGNTIEYKCPKGHALIGNITRKCEKSGMWSDSAPTCKYIDCNALPPLEHGSILLSEKRTTYSVQATYTCHENYTLIGNENRTCQLDGWTGKQPQCLIDWCPDPPKIPGGTVILNGKRAGSTAVYDCESGFVLIGEPVLSCGLGGEWTKPPTCRFVDCGSPARPDRGSSKLLNDSTTVGSVVKYQCDDDYWLVGPSELSCTKDGKWSGDPPVCELITCDTPHVPPGSFVVGYDYNAHSTIEYHCDPGHILRGESLLKCLENGEWSGDGFPFCEYIDCGTLQPIPYGSFKYLQNTTYVGSEAIYSCTNSHKLNGPTKRTCLESGHWSDATPKCEEIRCAEPVLAPHSILSVTGNDRMYGRTLIRTPDSSQNSVQTYKIGALAKYRCERGYKIVGEPLVNCEESGFWSGGVVPECVYVDCKNSPSIEFGKVTLATNATYYGAAALYECNSNYKLDGVSRRLCAEDGTWGHEMPACKEITCTEPELTEYLLVDSNAQTVGSVAKYSCTKGRYIVGNDTRICLKNGQWSGRLATCKSVDCGRPAPIENGRVIVVNESTIYGGSAEYHCVPNSNRIGPYLRKCLEDGKWSGAEVRCELSANEAQEGSGLGTGIAIGAAIIVILLILIGLFVLHRNKARPVKNTENVQAAESKEDQNAAVMSYSGLQSSRRDMDIPQTRPTFNTFQTPQQNGSGVRSTENIYDQIPSDSYYDAPYEMRSNDDVYEPEPSGNVITINGIAMIR